MRKMWTQKDIDELHKLFDSGIAFSEISVIMERSESSIKHKCSRLGLKRKKGRAFIRAVKNKQYWAVCKKREVIFIHRVLGEKKVGRPLRSNEVVHHKNRNSLDNRKCNLQVMTISEHMKEHYQDRELDSKGQFL